jgi:hypothetical protein
MKRPIKRSVQKRSVAKQEPGEKKSLFKRRGLLKKGLFKTRAGKSLQ